MAVWHNSVHKIANRR